MVRTLGMSDADAIGAQHRKVLGCFGVFCVLVACVAIAGIAGLAWLFWPTGLDPSAKALAEALRTRSVINLSTVPDFSSERWDRVYFIGPYTRRESVEKQVGAVPRNGWDSAIFADRDEYILVILKDGGRIAAHFDFPRNIADLFSLTERVGGFSREEAVFPIVVRAADGVRVAVVPNGSAGK